MSHSLNLFSNSLVATSLRMLGSICFCSPSSILRRVAVSSLVTASKSRYHTAPSTTSSDSASRQLLDKFQYRPSQNMNVKCSPPTHSSVVVEESILKYDKDKYKGVIIDSTALPVDVEEFIYKLKYSLDHWKSIGRRGVWLKIPLQKSHFIAPAVDIGFVFHHAEKEYLMLNYWLSAEENRMPPNASHQVGVGSVVLCEQDGKKKLLLVQEKSGPLRGSGIWKLPTGLVEQGEDIATAAEREVLEETGVAARFVGVLCFRHAHDALFGKSDLFFLCLLQPRSVKLAPQEAEIAACEWLDPEVYLQQDFFLRSEIYSKINRVVHTTVSTGSFPSIADMESDSDCIGAAGADGGQDNSGRIADMNESVIAQVDVNVNVNVTALVTEKLPIGFRPGMQSLYFFPGTAPPKAT